MIVVRLFHCPVHVYSGHHGRDPGVAPMQEASRIRLIAGRGVDGDRYSVQEGARGQVTFFAEEVWRRLCAELRLSDRGPDLFRRNVVVRGVDLNLLIGSEFEVQGVRFRGIEHCRPCYWMDRAFGPGAHELLGRWQAGGLRASVLTDGWIAIDGGEAQRCSA
jgi:MOSC domain-containing protein YiiM